MNRTSRLPIVVVLVVSLVVAVLARQWSAVARMSSGSGMVATATARSSAAGLARMNSYALALLLGGLRGPLVMILWPSSEEQKARKQLEDFDTKIEWIRLLQAEFDTVHIFQIWNKAYNISVQMANLGNKYRTILDALDYARSVDAERPNNINILTAIGQVYFDKLGNSAEKVYYRQRIREESMVRQDQVRVTIPPQKRALLTELALAHGVPRRRISFSTPSGGAEAGSVSITLPKPIVEKIRAEIEGPGVSFQDRPYTPQDRRGPGWQRTELDPLLDANGNLLPQLLEPRVPRPPSLPANSDWQDGSELQYLRRFEPFPYGVSPFALAYNYYKRSQVLMEVNKQRHAQLSDLVIDSRPALALKNWSEEEWERGRRAELEAFALRIPSERLDMELPTAGLKLDAPIPRRAPLDEAIYSYRRSAELVLDAITEYERHLANDKTNLSTYESHMDGLRAQRALTLGDHHYLRAMDALNPPDQQRAEQIQLARQNYLDAVRLNQLMVLRYFITEDIAQRLFPPGVTRANIAQKNLSSEQIEQLWNGVAAVVGGNPNTFQHGDEWIEFSRYVDRAKARLGNLPSL